MRNLCRYAVAQQRGQAAGHDEVLQGALAGRQVRRDGWECSVLDTLPPCFTLPRFVEGVIYVHTFCSFMYHESLCHMKSPAHTPS